MKKKILPFMLLSFVMIKVYSQSFLKQAIRGERGISRQFAAVPETEDLKFNTAQLKGLLELNENSELVLKRSEQDKLGFIHYRYYQTYKNIPVENSMFIVHTKNGLLKSLGGSIVTDFDEAIDARATIKVSQDNAITAAIKYVGAKVYAWQQPGMEKALKNQFNNAGATYAPKASMVWYSPTDDVSPRDLRLCYKVDVYATLPLSRAYYFVDAITGKVIGKKDEIFYSDATGTAATAYSGTQTIHSDLYNGSYRLRDLTKGGGIITLHGETASSGNDYTSTSSNWALTGTNQAALDAHYGVSQTYSFYYTVFNRNSYDDAGTALTSYVNIPNTTDNAYWDGTAMNYGKRSTGAAGGVTGIDVTGHELTHGVTQETSNLNYSKEPGAMNESMSDIFGKSVQFWSKPSDVNWKLSNDMNWFIRDMGNPNAYDQPDTYKGTDWATSSADNYGVHTNSGVGNFMFYLLVTGGNGSNDNNNAYTVTGIGLTEADAILYRTNTTYLTATSQYADWRTACINAAADLYGASSNEVIQVENAWYAVGVGTAGGGGGTCITPSGLASSSVTSSSATVSWSSVAGAAGYNLQYKTAAATSYTTVTGITATSYNLTGLSAATTYNYKVQTVCSGTSTSSYSSTATFTTPSSSGITYCNTTGSTTYEYINQVVFGSINKTSGNNNGYGHYISLSTTIAAGSSARIYLTPGFAGTAYHEYWSVYIDYNQDGVFQQSEQATITNSTTTANKLITIPSTAKTGATRMRIIMHYNSTRTATCGTFADGEVEDYTVNITGGAFAQSAIAATLTTAPAILVTPNPAKNNNVQVLLQLTQSAPVTLRITDLSGRSLHSQNALSALKGRNVYNLNNMHLASGTYIILAEQNNRIVGRSQFIVAE